MADEPTPTRAERKRLELRGEIVDGAFAEFSERGYHQTGIADIARRVGIGHGTAYLHFKNKRDIVDHVVDELVARVMDALAAENSPDAATTLEEYREQSLRIARALASILMEDPRASRMLLLEATSVDAEMTERVMGLLDVASQLVAGYLENGIERGYVRADLEVAPTADAVVGMVLAGGLRFLRDPGDAAERERFGEAVVALLLDGVAKPGAGR
jgi:AcrR family transcriptional regulator